MQEEMDIASALKALSGMFGSAIPPRPGPGGTTRNKPSLSTRQTGGLPSLLNRIISNQAATAQTPQIRVPQTQAGISNGAALLPPLPFDQSSV
jgi:hypothetical protein